MKAKVGAQSNMSHKLDKGHVMLPNQKLDFSKLQAKVNTWRKTEGSSNKKVSDKMKVYYDHLAGRVTKCSCVAQPRLNESHSNSNRCGRAHKR
jgi:hypothetical protein